ncbi:MAG: tRNA pseudouridine(55) synthase, partial [Spirochaetia bacterium]|nr:tRNA pseudouridine(55) synthase [Spirochaetia bacterium]
MTSGIILGDKPTGITSARFVGDLKRTLKEKKVGHAGTLDRFASGLVILLAGKGTAFAAHFLELDKSYRAVFVFGRSTDTHDPEGSAISEATPAQVSEFLAAERHNVIQQIADFQNQTIQTPPLYSALKKNGERFSDRARRGQTEMPKARAVRISQASVESMDVE